MKKSCYKQTAIIAEVIIGEFYCISFLVKKH